MPATITTQQIIDAVQADDGTGFCLACGAQAIVDGIQADGLTIGGA